MKKLFYLTLCFCAFSTIAQTVTPTVLSNNGGYATALGGSIQWTIGEPVSETYTNTTKMTTMGFHQPELGMATLIKEQGQGSELLVYPNPVRESLTVSFKDLELGNYKMQLVDNIGKIIFESQTEIKADSQLVNLNMTPYAAGTYFLRINNGGLNKTVKITKVY